MKEAQVDLRERLIGRMAAPVYPFSNVADRARLHLERDHAEFARRVAMAEAKPAYTPRGLVVASGARQDAQTEFRAARLALENDQLRVERAMLLTQLAAQEVEIDELKARLAATSEASLDIELAPTPLTATFRVRAKPGTFRKIIPSIHPDDVVEEGE